MSHRDKTAVGNLRRGTGDSVVSTSSRMDAIQSPFGNLAGEFSESELRESAYEIVLASCRNPGARPLTYVSQSDRSAAGGAQAAPLLQRSLTSTAASKVKKALGMRSLSSKKKADSVEKEETGGKTTTMELFRVQMRISELSDARIKRALLRIAAGQLRKRMESLVLPLELLHQLNPSDFGTQHEHLAWKKRNLKLLQAGLLSHPCLPLDKASNEPKRLQQLIRKALETPTDTVKQDETMQLLRTAVMSLASRSLDGSVSEACHWADGCPLNLRIYETLLGSCFDVNDGSLIIDEVDDIVELVKNTWTILGISKGLHNLCFLWVLFHHYVSTEQIEDDLLSAANNMLEECETDARETKGSDYFKFLRKVLQTILDWAETRLLAYHDSFNTDNIESMDCVVSLTARAANLLYGDSVEHRTRSKGNAGQEKIDFYIRSSLKSAFVKRKENAKSNKNLSKPPQKSSLPRLSALAQDIAELAFTEKAIFSPVLKKWHPQAAGVAIATLHSYYGKELKRFTSNVSDLTPDAIEVLTAADKLERDLVQIAVQDSADSEDGGKSIIHEMPPYEAGTVMSNLVKLWIKTRVDRIKEWIDRNVQQEVWNSQANKDQIAPSAIEVLRLLDETLEAFFLLPIQMHADVLPDLLSGLDNCMQTYISKVKQGCGSRKSFIPAIPPLTRCSTESKFSVFGKKEKAQKKSKADPLNTDCRMKILQLCVRLNSLHYLRTQIDSLGKRSDVRLKNCQGSYTGGDPANGTSSMFALSLAACVEGVKQISEVTAYRIVFHDLSNVLYDSLYVGEPSSSRIDPFLQALEPYLEVLSSTLLDRVRTRVITDVLKAALDGFMLVLLAGGSSRAFSLQDSQIIEEDLKLLTDLFWSNGDGLPEDLIDQCAITASSVLPLFSTPSESLVEQFQGLALKGSKSPATSKLPLPPTTGKWSPSDPNTLLRVLCYRCDDVASRFLKRVYNFPKKL